MTSSDNIVGRRQYAFEGAVSLFSSQPSVLMPADIYAARQNPHLMTMLDTANIYFITLRKRIYIEFDSLKRDNSEVTGAFLTSGINGPERTPFNWTINNLLAHEYVIDAQILPSCTHILIQTNLRSFTIASHIVMAQGKSELHKTQRDLQVVYIGQAQGRKNKRNAIQRLVSHSTLQRIMADLVTFSPEYEMLLLLYRFEHSGTIISTGGDLTLDPLACAREESAHLSKLSQAALSRETIVTLAEAAMIRHFRPHYNELIKNTEFESGKLKFLKTVLNTGMTGLIVEANSAIGGGRLFSEYAFPTELSETFPEDVLTGKNLTSESMRREWEQELHLMEHNTTAKFSLTTSEERNNFLHGMRWNE